MIYFNKYERELVHLTMKNLEKNFNEQSKDKQDKIYMIRVKAIMDKTKPIE